MLLTKQRKLLLWKTCASVSVLAVLYLVHTMWTVGPSLTSIVICGGKLYNNCILKWNAIVLIKQQRGF